MSISVIVFLIFTFNSAKENSAFIDKRKVSFYEEFMYESDDKEALKLKLFTERLTETEKQEYLEKIKEIRFELLKESVQLESKKNSLEKDDDTAERVYKAVKCSAVANILIYAPYIVDCIIQQSFDSLDNAVKENRVLGILSILGFGFLGYCVKTSLDEKKEMVFEKSDENLRSDFIALIAQRKLENKDIPLNLIGNKIDSYDAVFGPHVFGFEYCLKNPILFKQVLKDNDYRPYNPNSKELIKN